MKPRLQNRFLAIALPVGCLFISHASAQSIWRGTTGNNSWANAAGWDPGIPANNTDIIIANSTATGLNLDNDRTVASITFGDEGTRTSTFNLNTTQNLRLTITGGIIANGDFPNGDNQFNLRGNTTISSDQTWSVGGSSADLGPDHGLYFREITGGTGGDHNTAVRGWLRLDANVTKTGTGKLLFAGINVTGDGDLTIEEGSLKFNAGQTALLSVVGGGGSGEGRIIMNNATAVGIYQNSGQLQVTRPFVMNDTSTFLTRNGGGMTIASPVEWNGTHNLDIGSTTTLSGEWTGEGVINRTGGGTLNLTGDASEFEGGLNVSASGTTNLNGSWSSAPISKSGTGTLNLNGDLFLLEDDLVLSDTGLTNINSGYLPVGVILNSGARLGGTPAIQGNVVSNDGGIVVSPFSETKLHVMGDLTLNGVTNIQLSTTPSLGTPFVVLTYEGNLTGSAANLALQGGGYRQVNFDLTEANQISLTLDGGFTRTWNGDQEVEGGNVWNINNSENWLEGDQKFFQLDHVSFGDDGAGTVALAGTLFPSSVIVASDVDYTFSGSAGNFIGGTGGLTKSGFGTLTLNAPNTFSGGLTVSGGIVRAGNNLAFGANGQTITVAEGASLDLNGQINGHRNYHAIIAGEGLGGEGAIVSYGTSHNFGFDSITLAGDATIGGSSRWDLRPSTVGLGFLNLDGHTLTKRGGNFMGFVDSTTTGGGDIVIEEGTLAFTRMDATDGGTVTVNSFGLMMFENYSSGAFSKHIILNQGTLQLQGGAFFASSPVTLNGFGNIHVNSGTTLSIGGVIDGDGGLTKINANGTLVLHGDNTYTGDTDILTGNLVVNGNQSAATGEVRVNSGATLSGNGTLGGEVSAFTGSIVSPGDGIGTLTTSDNATLQGSLQVEVSGAASDRLDVGGNLDISDAILDIAVVNPPLSGVYIIASYGSLTGEFLAVNPGTLPETYELVYNYEGSNQIALVGPAIEGGYDAFEAAHGISGAGPGTDSDNDGIPNGIEFVIGGIPAGPGSNSNHLLPEIEVSDTHLNFVFRRTVESIPSSPYVEYGNDLEGWTPAENGVNGVIIEDPEVDAYGAGIDRITVRIPRSLATPENKLFARLGVNIPTP